MATYYSKFGKFKGYLIDVRDWATGFRWAKRTCMPYLKTYWNIKFDTLCIKWIIASISRRQIPKPLDDSKSFEPQLIDTTSKFAYGLHWSKQIYRSDSYKPVWKSFNQ
jgi:hypothetical protein